MLTQEIYGEEFSIDLHIFQLNDPIRLSVSVENPTAVLAYVLQGNASYIMPEMKEVRMTGGYYYLIYFPSGSHFLQPESDVCAIVQIELRNQLLLKLSKGYIGNMKKYTGMENLRWACTNRSFFNLWNCKPLYGLNKRYVNLHPDYLTRV